MYCVNCGAEIPEGANSCPMCGKPTDNSFKGTVGQNPYQNGGYYPPNPGQPPYPNQPPYSGPQPNGPYFVPVSNEPADTWLKVLSFFIPIAGIILYIVDHEKKPVSAHDCLKWALISIGIGVAMWIICFIIIIVLGITTAGY